MAGYRFRWDAFDDRTLIALAGQKSGTSVGSPEEAKAFLARAVKRPREEFVRDHLDTLRNTWLPRYEGLGKVVEQLVEAGVGPSSFVPPTTDGQLRFVRATRNCGSLRRAILDAMIRFGDQDPETDQEESFVRKFAVLEPRRQGADGRRPHGFQEEAWSRLDADMADAARTGVFRGLLVMPTGSGKTFTAVRWLTERVLDKGGRVLWIAHQQELLNQAAAEFHRLAGLALHQEKLRVRVVSAIHCAAHQIDPSDDVVVASIHVLARRPEAIRDLLTDERLFVVIDEAHHAPAKSYKDLIHDMDARGRSRLLGLTATPTRTIRDERPMLAKLFGGRVIHQVDLRTLIDRKILATPHIVRVKTGTRADADLTDVDRRDFLRFHEMTEHVRQQLIDHEGRNACIVGHYLANREKYGPTLIFAIDVTHAARLADRLRREGVRADYVASYRPIAFDGEDVTTEEVIRRFRAGELDVLVNCQILTEGVDLPAVQTVFLARPTMSEILLRQMIGRALRGPAAGGTEVAYLVSFEDHWAEFTEWQEPMSLVPDIVEVAAGAIPPEEEGDGQPVPPLTPEELAAWLEAMGEGILGDDLTFAEARRAQLEAKHLDEGYAPAAFEAVPEGRFVLEDRDGDEPVVTTLFVYPHQRPFWDEYRRRLEKLAGREVEDSDIAALAEEVFADCDDPVPSQASRQVFGRFVVDSQGSVSWSDVQGRADCDPEQIAREIVQKDLGPAAQSKLVSERYRPLARAIYRSEKEFRTAIQVAVDALTHPEDAGRRVRTIPVFEPRPDKPMAPGPAHDLVEILGSVRQRARELLALDSEPPFEGRIEFTKNLVKGYAGVADFEPTTGRGAGRIRINRLLDSPDVPATVVEFVVWHEYLHLYLKAGHTADFRQHERKWPAMLEAERFLDGIEQRFGVEYRPI